MLFLEGYSQNPASEIDSKWKNLKMALIRRFDHIIEFSNYISKSNKGDLKGLKESKEISSALRTDLNNLTSIDSLLINRIKFKNDSLTNSFKIVLKKINIDQNLQKPNKSQNFLIQLEGIDNKIYFEKKEFNKACRDNGRVDLLFDNDEHSNIVEDIYKE